MKNQVLIAVLLFLMPAISVARAPVAASQTAPAPVAAADPMPADQENARKAHQLLDQAIQALGGSAYLNARNLQEEGRAYSFYHGNPTSNGVFFWRIVEYPDKERIELTKQRDIATVYVGDKAFEITYKGPHAIEEKDLQDYLRRRRFSLETVLRTWLSDRSVAFFYDGNALAGNLPAQRVTLINARNESVSLYFDADTHLPIKKTHTWRDPTDKELNREEETYNGYRLIQGVQTPFGFTRYYNGDMQSERFITAASYDQPLNEAMFDANSGYNPNKPQGKAVNSNRYHFDSL